MSDEPEITLPMTKHHCNAGWEQRISAGTSSRSLPKGTVYWHRKRLPVGTVWKCSTCGTYWIAGRPQHTYRKRKLVGISHVPVWRKLTRHEVQRHRKGKLVRV